MASEEHVLQELRSLHTYVKKNLGPTMGAQVAALFRNDPFVLLVACILSLRARDTAVLPVVLSLFAEIEGPGDLLSLSDAELESLLYSVGHYRKKAAVLKKISTILVDTYHGAVPTDPVLLGQLPGVGPKTVAFMDCLAFGRPALCVDTHVHRLANRFGWVHTRTPEETEAALRRLLPQKWWCMVNDTLVRWGQQVCIPRGTSRQWGTLHAQCCPCQRNR